MSNQLQVTGDFKFKNDSGTLVSSNGIVSAIKMSVKDFGAIGDGVTDDTTAIQNAINYGGSIYFPNGTYNYSSQLVISNEVILFGDGILNETILLDYGILITNTDNVVISGLSFIGVENFTNWEAGGSVYRQSLKSFIQVNNSNNCLIENIKTSNKRGSIQLYYSSNIFIENIIHNGFFPDITTNASDSNYYTVINIRAGQNNIATNIISNNIGSVILIQLNSSYNIISNIFATQCHDNGIYNSSGSFSIFSNSNIDYCLNSGVKARGSGHIVSNNVISNSSVGITITGNGTTPDIYNANGFGTICNSNIINNPSGYAISIGTQDGFLPRDITISNNTIENHTGTGGYAAFSFNAIKGLKISSNKINGSTSDYAVVIAGSSETPIYDCSFLNNTITDAIEGLRLIYVEKSLINNNNFNNISSYSIDARYSNNNICSSNIINDSSQILFSQVYTCINNVITNNYAALGSMDYTNNIISEPVNYNLFNVNQIYAQSIGIGTQIMTAYNLRIKENITGGTTAISIAQQGTVQSDVTGAAYGFLNNMSTISSIFNLTNYYHYNAEQGTIGTDSSVISQTGFFVQSSLIGATNNYGFRGSIPSGTNRWNIYMGGTASNFLNGTTLIGSTSDSGLAKLQITGAIQQSSVTSSLLKTNSSGVIIAAVAGTDYVSPSTLTGYVPYTGATSDVNIGSYNFYSNAYFGGFTSVAASGTQIVLTISSTPSYLITGSGGQTIKLPNATTLPNGTIYSFNNNQSSGAISVNNNSNTLVKSIPSGGYLNLVLIDNSNAAGSWDSHFQAPANVSWSTNTFDYVGSITGATWNGVAVAVNRGGTGQSSYTDGQILIGNSTGNTLSKSTLSAGTGISITNGSGTITIASSLTNPVTGTGTTNTHPKFTGSSTIGDSNITDTGSLITLGSNSYVNGRVGIGSTPSTNINLLLSRNITGAVTSYALYQNGTIQSDVTTSAIFNATFIGTAAASFTVNNAYGNYVGGTTIGTGSAISTQQAYYVHSSFTGATNNYAFRSLLASNTNVWNLYMDGTANNYLAGILTIGSTTVNASASLQITSTTQGFLPPRMTTTQKNAISSPATGLVVFDTTLGKLCVFSTTWQTITSV